MKLKEIWDNKPEKRQILVDMGLINVDDDDSVIFAHEFNPDGSLNILENYMNPHVKLKDGHLATKIKKIDGCCDLDELNLTSLKNCPDEVNGYFSAQTNRLTSFEGMPSRIEGGAFITRNNITSLVGINEIVKGVGLTQVGTAIGILQADFHKITEGGLGLILIEGKFLLEMYMGALPIPFKIIQKYLGRPNDLFECQTELIDNGYEEYAQL